MLWLGKGYTVSCFTVLQHLRDQMNINVTVTPVRTAHTFAAFKDNSEKSRLPSWKFLTS